VGDTASVPVKQPPYDQDDDLEITLLVEDVDELAVNPISLNVEIARPSGILDSYEITDFDHPATGSYHFTYRVPAEWGVYHGRAMSQIPDGQVVQQFDFPVQKPGVGP
jgi:hypothetical protein